MKAIWREDGYVLEMNAAVPDLAALRQRFGWLHKVDSRTWLDAMPANVVKAANHEAAVREILAGLPLPPGFDTSDPQSGVDHEPVPGRCRSSAEPLPADGSAAGAKRYIRVTRAPPKKPNAC